MAWRGVGWGFGEGGAGGGDEHYQDTANSYLIFAKFLIGQLNFCDLME